MTSPPLSGHDDRRRQSRRDAQLTARVLCESAVSAIDVGTRNVSKTGVCLMSAVELRGDRMLLELNHPDHVDALVECEVKHRSRYDRVTFGGQEVAHFVCGLQFVRSIPRQELHPTVLAAFEPVDISVATDPAMPRKCSEDQQSLMPLLSAIGIIVVHLARLPML